ncbi:hypothetical protein F5882DRAFT_460080 [Hyaloscypha sp. PMI_1271]|nr:hypothetical protein F5882DRAFT_460080 [Hyaloscypha sp. PMI_1271]
MKTTILPLALALLMTDRAAPLPTGSDTDNDGKHKHLDCRPKERYGSSDLESDDDGPLAKLVGGPGRKTPWVVGLGVGGERLCTGRREGKK